MAGTLTPPPQVDTRPATAPAWRQPTVIGAVAAAGTALLAVGNPDTTHVPLCPLKAVTGLDCPFCGSLRAVHDLTHLRIGDALSHNVVFAVAAPFLVAGWAWWLHRAVTTGRDRPAFPQWAVLTVCAVLVAFAVARNVPALGWLDSAA